MVRHGEREACDDDVAQGFTGHIDASPEAISAAEDAVGVVLEFGEHLMPWHTATLHEQPPAAFFAVRFEFIGQGGHLAVAGEQNEGTTDAEVDEMGDPVLELVEIARLAGLRHLFEQVELHLLLEVEGAFDQGGAGFFSADAIAEVADLGVVADTQSGAGEDAGFVTGEKDLPKTRRNIDGYLRAIAERAVVDDASSVLSG